MNDSKNADNKVIDLASFRFPVGSKVWHEKYQVCYVTESRGNNRKIKAVKFNTDDMDWVYASVHVNELKFYNSSE